ncbi:SDR family NAD(P)-dependent oxidoreductase [uncultured Microbacterium sp.]|uniref:SDR family NAD(P)-dependent oxidoreductase n=1 Tax=uncultured Microbacterium sp. TaxID=191216 RepID=UPI0028D2FF0E|nr:SDR family NAD(P)-dependent oxidoreductase [uncultured Microbacterium sp.]
MTSPKTWMITGGNRGLGLALTLRALSAGHSVVATVRGDHSLPAHDRLTVLALDVRDRTAAFDVVGTAASQMGSLDVLVNNAGYGLIGAAEEVSEDDARAIIETNTLGPLWLSQAVIPIMRAQGTGHIVQISTVGAVGTVPLLGLYNASKWGLEAFSEAMAAEVRPFGIRVSLIEPGALDTDWAGGSMRFGEPRPEYDALRLQLFGTTEVPWPATGESTGGTHPDEAADAIFRRVCDDDDERMRVLVGDDAPGQVRAALALRQQDYARDPRFAAD